MTDVLERVRPRLPLNVLQLLDDLQTETGRKIGIREFTPEDEAPARAQAGLRLEGRNAQVLVRDAHTVGGASVFHELLHLQRYWIDRVPQLVALRREYKGLAAGWENELEHLVTLPRQAESGPFEQDRWDAWARDDWQSWSPQLMLRRARACLDWAHLPMIKDPQVIQLATKTLEISGLLEEAQAFEAEAQRLIGDKARLCELLVDAANFLRSDFGLLDVAEGDGGGPARPLPPKPGRRWPSAR